MMMMIFLYFAMVNNNITISIYAFPPLIIALFSVCRPLCHGAEDRVVAADAWSVFIIISLGMGGGVELRLD